MNERPEHNTYDFPDDIETIFDVCDEIKTARDITNHRNKQEYIKAIRKLKLGTDLIYLHLSFYYFFIDKELHIFYESKISKEYIDYIA